MTTTYPKFYNAKDKEHQHKKLPETRLSTKKSFILAPKLLSAKLVTKMVMECNLQNSEEK